MSVTAVRWLDGLFVCEGELSADLRTRTRQQMQQHGIPQGTTGQEHPVTDAPLGPPADIAAVIGKDCPTCRGDGHIGFGPWCLRPTCPDCFDGRATIVVRVPCEHYPSGCPDTTCSINCHQGHVEHQVTPTAVLPIASPDTAGLNPQRPVIVVYDDRTVVLERHRTPQYGDERVNLGPNPTDLIGMWAVTPAQPNEGLEA